MRNPFQFLMLKHFFLANISSKKRKESLSIEKSLFKLPSSNQGNRNNETKTNDIIEHMHPFKRKKRTNVKNEHK